MIRWSSSEMMSEKPDGSAPPFTWMTGQNATGGVMSERNGSPGTLGLNPQGYLRSSLIGRPLANGRPRDANGKFIRKYASIEDKKLALRERRQVKYKAIRKSQYRISLFLLNEDYAALKRLAAGEKSTIPGLVRSFIFRGIEECKGD